MRRAPSVPLVALPMLLWLALLAGCSGETALRPELDPETTLFVQGPVDTVNHVVHLYWFGSDPDGDVVGFELRFRNPQTPADTAWVFTTRTDSVFTLYTGQSTYIAPVFEVRAIDDDGRRDRTPATQDFQFSNQPPSLRFTVAPAPAETTFYSLTLRWIPIDPDGDTQKMRYRVWLDGNAAGARLVTGTEFTVPSADFTAGDSAGAGTRTVYVQPIDDGGLAGALSLARWYVRPPVTGVSADLLVIDDMPTSAAGNAAIDAFFAAGIAASVPAGNSSVLRLQSTQPFRSAKDVEQTFGLFRAVLWYRGFQPANTVASATPYGLQPLVGTYERGIAAYLGSGGRVMFEGLNLVARGRTPGMLPEPWIEDQLACRNLYRNFDLAIGDSSASWGVNNGVALSSPVLGDSLRFTNAYSGLRAFEVRDTSAVLLWAAPGTLSQGNAERVAVGLQVPQPLGGRLLVVPFPMLGSNGYGSAPRVLGKLLQRLLTP
jgi:hypothetical protein